MKRYSEKQKAIHTLFDYEEKNNIPEDERLTYDVNAKFAETAMFNVYKKYPSLKESCPGKKPCVDIRIVEHKVSNLKYLGEL